MQAESTIITFPKNLTTEKVKEDKSRGSYKEAQIKEDLECNSQIPLVFSNYNSNPFSNFGQLPVHNNLSTIVSTTSHKFNAAVISTTNNQVAESTASQMSQLTSYPAVEIDASDISFQYDTAFKKPYFLKHSVFEDDIAAFKDESSPFILSTAASSLSSLTIDDDDNGDSLSVNRVELVKKKAYENWHQDPIGGVCEPLRTSKVIETKKVPKTLTNKLLINCTEKQNTNGQSNKSIYTISYEQEFAKEQQTTINWMENNVSDDVNKYSVCISINDHYLRCEQNTQFKADSGKTDEFLSKSEPQDKCSKTDKFRNIYQNKQNLINHKQSKLDLYNKNNSKSSIFGSRHREEQDNFDQNRFLQGTSRLYNNKMNSYFEDTNDINAYEEQLLDQCIRKGMAKVTKRNICEIKPFCWDLNQICLTTRAMLKINDEDIVKERKGECNKRCIYKKN